MTVAEGQFITIVSGLPRSGTSMMMRALEAGGIPVLTDGIRKADDDNPGGYYEFERVKQLDKNEADADWLGSGQGKVVKVIYRLLYDLPPCYQYKVIYLKRKIEEVIASQKAMLRRQRTEGSSLNDAALIKAFENETRKAEQWMEQQNNFDILRMDYSRIVEDPCGSMAVIDRFLGLGLDTEAMVKVVDPDLYRQRM